MNIWKKTTLCGTFAIVLLLIGGCKWFDTEGDPKGGGKTAPAAMEAPIDNLNINTGDEATPGKFSDGADDKSMGHSAFGDLRPVKGPNFPVVYFAYDRSTISEAERSKLDKVGAYLKKYPQLYLIVEGHCDERGTLEYNRALGERRSIGVKQYLEALGLSGERIRTISYGEEKPLVPGEHAKNRCAVLVPAEKI